ncbi:MAG: hypothetical protein AB7O91_00040 [Sphingomonas sp.]
MTHSFEMDRRRAMAMAACALLVPARAMAQPTGLDDLVARHVAARGGAAALDRVRSCRIEVEINERGQTLQGRYAADAAGLVRIDIYVGGNLVYREGVDREGVWQWPGDAPAPTPSVATGAANALLHGAENHLFGLHRFTERGHRLRRMPDQTLDGVVYPVIEVIYTTGHTSYFYVDPATYLFARRRDQRAYHPDVDSTVRRVETRFSDHQRVEGIVYSNRSDDIDLATGAALASNRALRRELNPALPDGLFARTYTPG